MSRFLLASLVAAATITSAHAAPIITLSSTAPMGATSIENFDSFAADQTIGVNALALSGSDGRGAKPAQSTGNYGSVLGGGTYAISFAPTSAFSFLLGSLDSYNHLTLTFSDATSLTYDGSQITNGLGSDGYVTYSTGTGPLITAASFRSDSNSFEFDNLAAGVPEPATWALLISGFGLVGAAMRRRSIRPSYAA
jgi:hypothetical protein